MQPDLFDGTYDNRANNRREVWKDGRVSRDAHRFSLGTWTVWKVMHKPWGSYPDYPGNVSRVEV